MSTRKSSINKAAKPPLALIAGPTASGKSDCAVRLALALIGRGRQAVVINADSAQVYADLAVLSARPAATDMRGVPHVLFGAWDGASACSAANWAERARAAIADVHAIDGVPILVGGTGLYLRTLLDGIAPVPEIDPCIRAEVRALPVKDAHAALQREDPARAAALAPADVARICRALEVVRSTGQSLIDWQRSKTGGISDAVQLYPAILLPPRTNVYQRCDARFAAMLAGGAIEEVRVLLGRCLDPTLPVMRAIGVAEITAYLGGSVSLDDTVSQGSQATRNYAKRQYTWFSRQIPVDWPRIESDDYELCQVFARLLRS